MIISGPDDDPLVLRCLMETVDLFGCGSSAWPTGTWASDWDMLSDGFGMDVDQHVV